jgi:hypothetical protein
MIAELPKIIFERRLWMRMPKGVFIFGSAFLIIPGRCPKGGTEKQVRRNGKLNILGTYILGGIKDEKTYYP